MKNSFEYIVISLKDEINKVINSVEMTKCNRAKLTFNPQLSNELQERFFEIVDKVYFELMKDKDNFYGYFLFQMERRINFNISSATGVNFKDAKYIMYFNPIVFLELNLKQMQSTIKHEILHIISFHIVRANELKNKYSPLTIDLAMDIVVNEYLDNLPPYSITINYVNNKYSLELKPYNTFEYYADNIQKEIDLLNENEKGEIIDSHETEEKSNNNSNDFIKTKFEVENSHNIWSQDNDVDYNTLIDFTQKYINGAKKGVVPSFIENIISAIKNVKGELPWNLYLKKLMGTMPSNKRKTTTRLSRRQPARLDLKGEITNYKAKIFVALDISGSISEEEFKQAISEVLSIVRNYNNEITIIECDKEIKSVYNVRSVKDIKKRSAYSGGTRFTPVFQYANLKKINLLIYFTDGKGENVLGVIPKNYKILWVISGRGQKLSLKESYGAVKKLKEINIKEDIDLKDIKTDGYSMNNQEPIF